MPVASLPTGIGSPPNAPPRLAAPSALRMSSCAEGIFSKAKQKSLVAGLVAHDFPLRRAEELVAQGEPASQLRRSLLHRPGPAASSEKTFHFCKTRILPQGEKRYTRPLRDDQLEIAGFGEANNDVANKSSARRGVQELTCFSPPTGCRFRELMTGERCAAGEADERNSAEANRETGHDRAGETGDHDKIAIDRFAAARPELRRRIISLRRPPAAPAILTGRRMALLSCTAAGELQKVRRRRRAPRCSICANIRHWQ